MKKTSVLFLILISILILTNFISVYAQESPENSIDDEDVEKIQNFTDKIPLDETGQIDEEKIESWKSKAEIRIEKINQWLDENVYWLKWVFGMRPEVSWLFAINFLLILTFLNGLVLNGDYVFPMLSKGIARFVGSGIFAFLLLSKFILNVLAKPATLFITSWWGQLIIILGLIILNPLLAYYFRFVKGHKEKSAKQKEELDRQRLHSNVKVAESLTKGLTGK